MNGAAQRAGIDLVTASCGSMVGMFFTSSPVHNYSDVQSSNVDLFQGYFRGMLEEGIYLAPSAFETGFISTAHTDQIIDRTTAAAERVLKSLA
jgi:glutamate-1-semialdehyde 2,1-aminomutase